MADHPPREELVVSAVELAAQPEIVRESVQELEDNGAIGCGAAGDTGDAVDVGEEVIWMGNGETEGSEDFPHGHARADNGDGGCRRDKRRIQGR